MSEFPDSAHVQADLAPQVKKLGKDKVRKPAGISNLNMRKAAFNKTHNIQAQLFDLKNQLPPSQEREK